MVRYSSIPGNEGPSANAERLFTLVAVKAKLSGADKGKSCDREAVVGPSGNANAGWITERSEGYERGEARNEASTKFPAMTKEWMG